MAEKVLLATEENFTLDTLLEISGSKIVVQQLSEVQEDISGLTPTSNDGTFNNITNLVDGSLATFGSSTTGAPVWVKLDLLSEYILSRIKLWHLVGGTQRIYKDVVVQISTDDATWTTVFNNDADNSAGEGAGSDAEYTETEDGKTFSFGSTGLTARYIRIWTNGNNVDSISHFSKIEVYKFVYPENQKAVTAEQWKANTFDLGDPVFQSSVTETGNAKVKFQPVLDGVAYFWDGAEWVIASEQSFDYANATADINSNLPLLFDTPDPKYVKWNIYFNTTDTTESAELTSMTFKYDLDDSATGTDKPEARKVYFFVYDTQGNAVSGVTVQLMMRQSNLKYNNALLKTTTQSRVSDEDGYVEFLAVPNEDMTPNTFAYTLVIESLNRKHNVSIPAGTSSLDLGTLI